MKDWILVHLTISNRHEKYLRDILIKNLTDEKVTVLTVVDLYWTFKCLCQKHQKETADTCVISRRWLALPPSPSRSAFLYHRPLFLLRWRCDGLTKLEILKWEFYSSNSAFLSSLVDKLWMQTWLIVRVCGKTIPMTCI